MPDEPDAVGVHLLVAPALILEAAEGVEIPVKAFLQFDLADHRRVREIGVARDVVAVRLGIDQVADRRLFFELLAPAHRIDRLLRRVDHDIAVTRLDKARIAAGEIDLGEAVGPDPAHATLPDMRSLRAKRSNLPPVPPGSGRLLRRDAPRNDRIRPRAVAERASAVRVPVAVAQDAAGEGHGVLLI